MGCVATPRTSGNQRVPPMSLGSLGQLLGLLLLLASVTLPAASATPSAPHSSPPPGAAAIRLPVGPGRVTLSLIRHFGIPAAQVTIGGQDAGWFLIDTASSQTVIDAKVAARL